MTELLERAVAVTSILYEKILPLKAARFLEELADEQAWAGSFTATTDAQWDRMAAMVRQEIAAGDSTPLDEVFPSRVSKP